MILYHGTNENFGDIDLSKSRIGKDFHKVSMQYLFATERATKTLVRL